MQCAFINDYPERKLVFALPVFIYICILTANMISIKAHEKVSKIFGTVLVIALLMLFSKDTFNSIYKNPKYNYKTAMEDLSTLNNERVIGGWAYGFRLYNNYKPYLNQYVLMYSNPEHYYALLYEAGKNGDAKYSLEYDDDLTERKMKSIGFHKERLAFKSNDPTYRDIYIYKFLESNPN